MEDETMQKNFQEDEQEIPEFSRDELSIDGDTPAPTEPPVKPRKKKNWYLIGGILVVFLAAAAFLGGQLLNPNSAASGLVNGLVTGGSFNIGGGTMTMVTMDIDRAPEIPDEKATLIGSFKRRKDQKIFIEKTNVVVSSSGNAKIAVSDTNDNSGGEEMEVVVTHDTKIYKDVTEFPDDSSGTIKVQQKVQEMSLDELPEKSFLSVWADKQGDRYVARVILSR
jgi:hypothetical protein